MDKQDVSSLLVEFEQKIRDYLTWIERIKTFPIPEVNVGPFETPEEWCANVIIAYAHALKNHAGDRLKKEIRWNSPWDVKEIVVKSFENPGFIEVLRKEVEDKEPPFEPDNLKKQIRFNPKIISEIDVLFESISSSTLNIKPLFISVFDQVSNDHTRWWILQKITIDRLYATINNVAEGDMSGDQKANLHDAIRRVVFFDSSFVGAGGRDFRGIVDEVVKEIEDHYKIRDTIKAIGENKIRNSSAFKNLDKIGQYLFGQDTTKEKDKIIDSEVGMWKSICDNAKLDPLNNYAAKKLKEYSIWDRTMISSELKEDIIIESKDWVSSIIDHFSKGADSRIEKFFVYPDAWVGRKKLSEKASDFYSAKEKANAFLQRGDKAEAINSLKDSYLDFKDELLSAKRQDLQIFITRERNYYDVPGSVRNLQKKFDSYSNLPRLKEIEKKIFEFSLLYKGNGDEADQDTNEKIKQKLGDFDVWEAIEEFISLSRGMIPADNLKFLRSALALKEVPEFDLNEKRWSNWFFPYIKEYIDLSKIRGAARISEPYDLPLPEIARAAENISRQNFKKSFQNIDEPSTNIDTLLNMVRDMDGWEKGPIGGQIFMSKFASDDRYKINKDSDKNEIVEKAGMFVRDYVEITSGKYFTDENFNETYREFIPKMIGASPSFSQGVKIANELYKAYHNNYNGGGARDIELIGKHPDASKIYTSATVKKYFETYMSLINSLEKHPSYRDFISAIGDKEKKYNIYGGTESIIRMMKTIQGSKKIGEMSEARSDIRKIEMLLELLGEDAAEEYFDQAEDKDSRVIDFPNWEDESNRFRFRVLEQGDPRYFTVGSETDCCQIIGGAGEEAAIDSFINKWAGVLVLEFFNGYDWDLAYQSYFHYVPEDNGYILDNIEGNEEVSSKTRMITGHSPENLYAMWASHIKEKDPQIKYVLLGKQYTVINTEYFGDVKMGKDPRSFKVDDPYSDWSPYSSSDLLSKRIDVKNDKNTIQLTSSGELQNMQWWVTICGIEEIDQSAIEIGQKVRAGNFRYLPSPEHLKIFDDGVMDIKKYLIAFARDIGHNTSGWEKKDLNWIEQQLFGVKKAWIDMTFKKVTRAAAYIKKIAGEFDDK